jgi:hypothetical protein
MDQAAQDRILHEMEDEARKLFAGSLRRVDRMPLPVGESPIEPGELVPRVVLTEPPGPRRWRAADPREAVKEFQDIPALNQFRHELPHRWPEIRHISVIFEADNGRLLRGITQAVGEERGATGTTSPR